MPLHDWTRVDDGMFHHFHQSWIYTLTRRLNNGLLPSPFFAVGEVSIGRMEPDVLTFRKESGEANDLPHESGQPGAAVLSAAKQPPQVAQTIQAESDLYVSKQDHVAVRRADDEELVSIIEIVSRGNKDSRMRFEQFLTKVSAALNEGTLVMVVDLHPPQKYDPNGIHAAIWDYLYGESDQPRDDTAKLTVVSYCADAPVTAYHEPLEVGTELPEMPLFLESDNYILLPLESTYEENWNDYPRQWREQLTSVQKSEEPK